MAASGIDATGYTALPRNLANQISPNTSVASQGVSLDEFKFVSRSLFYLVSPNETSYAEIEEVPNYFLKAMTYLPIMIAVECILLFMKGRRLPTFGDAMCSLCCGLLIFLPVAIVGQLEINMYIWCYEKFHIVDLQWDSPVTWGLCLLGVDLGLYTWHRAAHEINFIWAFHQVHHTSQEYNLTIGIRLPSFNRYVALLFYLPCALFFPPSVFYAHYQLNYIFQFWIHSDLFPQFGLLDYIINNPSLHRVHHGRNRYCIDKNYGAVFSFWDIIFGTFERERPGEEIFYGLVHSINSFDPIYIQFHHLKNIAVAFFNYDGISNKLSTILKGPGWAPGKSRLGDYNEIPEIPEDKVLYDKPLPFWVKVYVFLHYAVAFVLFFKIKITKALLSSSMVWLHGGFILWAMASSGMFLERRRMAFVFEMVRCAAYFGLEVLLKDVLTADPLQALIFRAIFAASFIISILNTNRFRDYDNKKLAKSE